MEDVYSHKYVIWQPLSKKSGEWSKQSVRIITVKQKYELIIEYLSDSNYTTFLKNYLPLWFKIKTSSPNENQFQTLYN